jgi:abequosyltransferase
MTAVTLSFCIPTLKRHLFIAETLRSIVDQLPAGVEIVIVDGNADDLTWAEVEPFAAAGHPIRYVRSAGGDTPSNEGFDRDLDRAVMEARGEWCWLFTDDDTLADGAIAAVLAELERGAPDLLVVDAEVRDVALARLLDPGRLKITGSRDYRPDEADELLTDTGDALTFVGVVVIRRALWMRRERAAYYGTGFLHVCVAFQRSPAMRARVVAAPLVRIRMGNAAWSARAFEIWMLRWPELIWRLPGYGDAAKAAVVAREPWHDWRQLLQYRAFGSMGRAGLKRLMPPRLPWRDRLRLAGITALPGPLAHLLMTVYLARSPSRAGSVAYNLALTSRHAGRLSAWAKRGVERLYGR